MKAGRAGGGDRQWPFGSVGVDQGDCSVGEPPVAVFEVHVLFDRREPVRGAVGVLLLCLATDLGEPVTTLLLIHHEQRVGRPVRASQRHRQPGHEHLLDLAAPARQSRNRLADAGPQAPGVIADRNPLIGHDFDAAAFHLDPARRHPDLVVAQDVVRHPVSVRAAVRPGVFQRCVETSAQFHVERDRRMLGGVQAHPDGPQRFDDLIVNRPDFGARRRRRQPAARAHRPLFGAAAHTGGTVEDAAVGVLPDPEDDLQRVVARVRDRPDLLRPRRVRLAHRGECVNDLMGEQLILGHQGAVVR